MHRQERERGPAREGPVSVLEIHYLLATDHRVEHYEERHRLGLFSHESYVAALRDAGLAVGHDPQGIGRGLYVGVSST